ncbi:hypothetical protein C942_04376 [Photobacterium marinum]|uniref:DUF3016 domain-containing protein n=1 Tax=Photobacterium marinum TaxID=1056511 RepID=L8JEJ7_9GAMM|nr:DUF3016 domain-containing protein [Photobacterium marinum]ELR66678.1 hypothetical protein C942_04376 [Photobacterium marinum]
MKLPAWLGAFLLVFSISSIADETIHFPPAFVTWVSPEQYRDIRTTGGSQKRFQKNLFKRLSEEFSEMARIYLKPDQTLHVQVTNVDLAGDTRFSSKAGKDIRVLTSITPPTISFNYQIKKGDNTLSSDSVKLTNMNYQSTPVTSQINRALMYEIKLIQDWAKKTLKN